MTVTQKLAEAFQIALDENQEISKRWIKISWLIGGSLPNSRLAHAIQEAGHLDIMIRCMEREFSTIPTDQDPLALQLQSMFSDNWIGNAYEIFRLLEEREPSRKGDDFCDLLHHLRMLRIPLVKHEIAADRKLSTPLAFQKVPPSNAASELYFYARDDSKRSHIMPSGISARGSKMWQVIDLVNETSYWLERCALSDRILALWGR
jgi:hypothetical protein